MGILFEQNILDLINCHNEEVFVIIIVHMIVLRLIAHFYVIIN